MLPTHDLIAEPFSPRVVSVDVECTELQLAPLPPGPLTEAAFCDWIASASVGQSIQYHEGFLLIDRTEARSALSRHERERLHAVARRAWIACELGFVHLVSQKLGDEHYRYIAVRSSAVLPGSALEAAC